MTTRPDRHLLDAGTRPMLDSDAWLTETEQMDEQQVARLHRPDVPLGGDVPADASPRG